MILCGMLEELGNKPTLKRQSLQIQQALFDAIRVHRQCLKNARPPTLDCWMAGDAGQSIKPQLSDLQRLVKNPNMVVSWLAALERRSGVVQPDESEISTLIEVHMPTKTRKMPKNIDAGARTARGRKTR